MWQKHAGFVAEVYSVLSISYKCRQCIRLLLHGCSTCLSRSAVCSLALDSEYSDTVRLWVSLSTLPPPDGLVSTPCHSPAPAPDPGESLVSDTRRTLQQQQRRGQCRQRSNGDQRNNVTPWGLSRWTVICYNWCCSSSVKLK